MALNFPNSPTDGQIYTDTATGYRWVWDSGNTTWKSTSTYAQTITVSSTQPGSPVIGQLWWNNDYGRLFVYYSDGDSSQWVDASPSDSYGIIAYSQANTSYVVANAAFDTANAAFASANTALQNTSGTFAGNLSVTGNVGIGTSSPSGKLHVTQTTSGTNGLRVDMPTGSETTASGIRVFGYSPAIELMDKDQVQNWHMAIDDNDGNKLVFARGYGPGQGIAPALAIDSSDRVTMPYMPAFWAVGSGTQSWSGATTYTKVNFSAGAQYVMSNKSAGWSQANSRYTAPVAGTYEFMLSFAVQSGPSTGPAALLYKNGSAHLEVLINYSSSVYNQTSANIMIDLNANDFIEFWIVNYNSTSFTIDLGRCKFSGKLIG